MSSEFMIRSDSRIDPKTEAIERAKAAWERIIDSSIEYNKKVFQKFGITGRQLTLLRTIEANSPLSLKELTALTRQHTSTIGQMVDRMVKLGWIFRMQDLRDRRRIILRTTRKGREILNNVPLTGASQLAIALDKLSNEEAIELANTIEKLAEIFKI